MPSLFGTGRLGKTQGSKGGKPMTSETYPYPFPLRVPGGQAGLFGPEGKQVRVMLAVSVVIHVGVLVMAASLRMAPSFEQPLASYQVSLIDLPRSSHQARQEVHKTLPHPVKAVVPLAPPKALPPAAKREMRSSAALPELRSTPKTARGSRPQTKLREARAIKLLPPVPQVASAPARPVTIQPPSRTSVPNDGLQEALRGIELPPEVPSFENLENLRHEAVPVAPKSAMAKLQANTRALLNRLKVPDAPVLPSSVPDPVPPVPKTSPQLSLTEEVVKQLASPPITRTHQEPETQVTSKAGATLQSGAKLQIPGIAPGFSAYLAQVQKEISKQWVPTQVETPAGAVQVVIRFRLHRDGRVSDVKIEQHSGNKYYDLAGMRAVLRAQPLPPFPPELPKADLDAHFSFTVGGPTG